MKDYETIQNCLLCNGEIKDILSFGDTPLANEFVSRSELDLKLDKHDKFDLTLVQCKECNHVQLKTIVNEERLYRHYLYVSGTNSTNVDHFKKYAEKVLERYFPDRYDQEQNLILDIGSNDGTFLKFFDNVLKIGVDPAENLVSEAQKNGVKNIPVFFNEETAKNEIKKHIPKGIKAKVITCNNMFAHNRDLKTVIKGVKELLSDDGTFIIENSYLLDMLDHTIFDVIYHEHMHHHHIASLIIFFDSLDMKIYDVERLKNHGGSIRVYTCRKSYNIKVKPIVNEILKQEESINLKLENFKNKIADLQNKLISKLNDIKKQGCSIAIYGVPAKATTLMYAFQLGKETIDFAIEDNPLKQGMFTPGKHIPIYSAKAINQYAPDYLLILAWNFADSIIKSHPEFKGKWIIPIPELKEIQQKRKTEDINE